MCNRKTKVRFMNLAIVCLSLSFASQFIGYVIPFWLQVTIDGTNISKAIYSLNETENFIDMTENYNIADENENNYNRYESTNSNFSNFDLTSFNGTSINETENYANRSFALWYINTCVNGECRMELYPELKNGTYDIQNYFEPGYNFSWINSKVPFSRQREFQIEATLALVLSLLSVILVWDNKKKFVRDIGRISEKCQMIRHCIVIAIVSVAGSLIGIPCLAYGNTNVNIRAFLAYERLTSTGYSGVAVGLPMGLIFSWFSNILASLACMFIFFSLSISIKKNTVHRTDTIALNHLQNHMVPTAPCFSANERIQGNIQLNSALYRNSVNANTQTDGDCGIFELPPPSYDDAMRQYNITNGTNTYRMK